MSDDAPRAVLARFRLMRFLCHVAAESGEESAGDVVGAS
jgi:hypothetical protein